MLERIKTETEYCNDYTDSIIAKILLKKKKATVYSFTRNKNCQIYLFSEIT